MDVLLFGGDERQIQGRKEALIEAAQPLEVVVTNDPERMEEVLPYVVVAASRVSLETLERAHRLSWFQRWYAGVEDLVESEVLRSREVTITNASGVHAEPVSEHVFALLLALGRCIDKSVRREQHREWPQVTVHRTWELAGKHMLIAGFGAIGRRIARIAKAHDMTVTGVRRNSDPERGIVGARDLAGVLPDADVVVNVLPHTRDTHRLFSDEMLRRVKPGSVFVNVGRGATVDQAALVDALQDGRISAAGLDVTEPEPLPRQSPLWAMPNVIITPHMAGVTPEYGSRAWSLFFQNLERFHSGKQLINVVDYELGY